MVLDTQDSAAAIGEIRREMAHLRQDMHREVRGVVRGAQSLADWRSVIRSYPWLCLGVSAAVGYLVVPGRRRATASMTLGGGRLAEVNPRTSSSGWNAFAVVSSLLAPVAVRAAQNYALQHLESWLATHPLLGPPPGSGQGPAESTEWHPGSLARADALRDRR